MLSGKGGECVACHGAHKVLRASAQLLAGPGPGCAQCHEAGSPEAGQGAAMARLLADLSDALERSDRILAQAAAGGIHLSQAAADQKAGREALAKARAAVHSFRQSEVELLVKSGSAIAARAYRAGESALKKK
jgi:predicted CXXCH cytochrome family protein